MRTNLIILISSILLISCGKVEDHYRIIGLDVKIAKLNKGPNTFCVDFRDTLEINKNDTIAIRVNLIREYYSADDSPSKGIMYSPRGWEGCESLIRALSISSFESDSFVLLSDTTINGFFPAVNNPHSCQGLGEGRSECDCQSAISYIDLKSFVNDFNSSMKTNNNNKYLGEDMEDTPLIFLATGFDSQNSVKIMVNLEFEDESRIEEVSNRLKIKY